MATNDLEAEITVALATIDPARPATLEAAAQRIRAAFEAGKMPEAIAAETAAAYTALGEPRDKSSCDLPVAVRSSAIA